MGFSVDTSISIVTVFLQGLISFLSPCVLPLVPLYIGYLAGGAKTVNEDGVIQYKQKKVMINTLFFVIGVSFAFFLLGFGFTTLGRFFTGNKMIFAKIGGIAVILFGLFQIGFLDLKILQKNRRLPMKLEKLTMNPAVAFVFGFTFSFAWTPCVGPALASVLLMASSAKTTSMGFALIGVYTLGFVIPFLAVGLFTGKLLDFFKKRQKIVSYTVKVGGVLLIFMGFMMFTGNMNTITGYLSNVPTKVQEAEQTETEKSETEKPETDNSETEKPVTEESKTEEETADSGKAGKEEVLAPDFTLTDQYGTVHTLSDYKGKVVFLNFWATWCGPCRAEMPDIQALYEEETNTGNVIILGIAGPKTEENPNGSDGTIEEINQFLEDNEYTYPVLYDTTGQVFAQYGISSFPTTFMIDADGNVFGYVSGTLSRDIMDDIISQTAATLK